MESRERCKSGQSLGQDKGAELGREEKNEWKKGERSDTEM